MCTTPRSRVRAWLLALTVAFGPHAFGGEERTTNEPVGAIVAVVRHGGTGLPIAGAEVRLRGRDVRAVSDTDGIAVFRGVPMGTPVRLSAELPGFTPDVRDVARVDAWNGVELTVMPNSDVVSRASRGSSGYVHTFGSADSRDSTRVRVEVSARDATEHERLALAIFPAWGLGPTQSGRTPLAKLQWTLPDEGPSLPARITVEPGSWRDLDLTDARSSDLKLARFEPASGSFVDLDVPVELAPRSAAVSFVTEIGTTPTFVVLTVDHSSWLTRARARHASTPTSAGVARQALVTVVEHPSTCDVVAHVPIACGWFGGSNQVDPRQGWVSGDLRLGASGAFAGREALLWAKLEAECGARIERDTDGLANGACAFFAGGGWAQGPGATPAGWSGGADLVVVQRRFGIWIDGVEIGHVTRPMTTLVHRSVQRDEACPRDAASVGNWPEDVPTPCVPTSDAR